MSDKCQACGHGEWTHNSGGKPKGECEALIADRICQCTKYVPMTADRDDLAAIMDAHIYCESARGPWRWCSCGLGRDANGAYSPAQHRAHVAQMVLESDWLRERDAAKWDEGEKTSDCICGHNILAHPKDDWRHCVVAKRGECDCTGFEPVTNPYRADGVGK